jgi:integrase
MRTTIRRDQVVDLVIGNRRADGKLIDTEEEKPRKSSRYGHRDATMILIGYRHGLRASELCDLQWSQVELTAGRLHVRRAKSGSPSVHIRCRATRSARYGVCNASRSHPRMCS